MRWRAALAVMAAAGLLLPAAAAAKGGVIWDRYPDVQSVGSPMKFTIMLIPPREGVRPLVRFRDQRSGAVVRVRASRSDLNGIAYGKVALPAHGPWDQLITVGGRPLLPGDSEPVRVGVGLVQTIPPAEAGGKASGSGSAPGSGVGSPWVWILSLASIGSALLVLAMRRRGRWGAG